MNNESNPHELTPEEIADMNKSRILSDSKVLEHGADIDAEGNINFTESQIKGASREMERDFSERRALLPMHGKENWKELVSLLSKYELNEKSYDTDQLGYTADKLVVKSTSNPGDGGGSLTMDIEIKLSDLENIKGKLIADIDLQKKDNSDEKKLGLMEEALEFINDEIESRK